MKQANRINAAIFCNRAAFFAATLGIVGCVQPATQATTPDNPSMTMPPSQIAKDKAGGNQRIMARLDGLSGDADPRLTALRSRLEQLGFTVMAMGVSPMAPENNSTASKPQRHSAFIVVAIDPSRGDMQKAVAQFRALETFSYVEEDQLLQQRK